MKRIEIIPLALKKIAQRKIQYEWVEETLRHPDQIADGYLGRRISQKEFIVNQKPMLLRVVVNEEQDRLLVVTVYLTSRMERYRR